MVWIRFLFYKISKLGIFAVIHIVVGPHWPLNETTTTAATAEAPAAAPATTTATTTAAAAEKSYPNRR